MLKFRCRCSCRAVLILPDGSEDTEVRCYYSGARVRVEGATPFLETDWLGCADPRVLLQALGEGASQRKARLFACASVHRLRHLLPESGRGALRAYESFAAGLMTLEDFTARLGELGHSRTRESPAHASPDLLADNSLFRGTPFEEQPRASRAGEAAWYAARLVTLPHVAAVRFVGIGIEAGRRAAEWIGRWATDAESKTQCDLLRDVFGNPFRPAALRPDWLAWNVGAVAKMARAIYDERTFADLPYLADALEEAGCDNEQILGHCREPGEHVRGCWLVDAVLGLS